MNRQTNGGDAAENCAQSKPVRVDCALGAIPFKRENRYMVMKRSDIAEALTELEQTILQHIALKVLNHRSTIGKSVLSCVVVESDWPEYEPTWAAIQRRMTSP
jgi:hypothetical protein